MIFSMESFNDFSCSSMRVKFLLKFIPIYKTLNINFQSPILMTYNPIQIMSDYWVYNCHKDPLIF